MSDLLIKLKILKVYLSHAFYCWKRDVWSKDLDEPHIDGFGLRDIYGKD